MRFTRRAALVGVPSLIAMRASADARWPSRPITIVVPFAAGGPTDVVGRLLASGLGSALGVSVIIDNRGGAGGIVGSRKVKEASADGYTLLLGTASTHAIIPSLSAQPIYDPVTDFVPIALVGVSPTFLLVNGQGPVRDLREFIDQLKKNGASSNYGSAGPGTITHLTPELFKTMAGVEATHVPYRGQSPALADLMADRLTFVMDFASSSAQYVKAGSLRALGFASKRRSAVLPDVPTMDEAGLPGFEASTWNVLFAPRATPDVVVQRLAAGVQAAMQDAEIIRKLTELGVEPEPGVTTPQATAAFVRAQGDHWRPIAKASGVVLD